MELFEYKAFDKKGKLIKSTISSVSVAAARQELRGKQLLVKSIKSAKAINTNKYSSLFSFGNTINITDLSMCLRQLATLLKSGLEVSESLKLMSEQSEKESLRKLTGIWRTDIIEGKSLSLSMRTCGFHIQDSVIAAVSIGEESGHLDRVLDRLSGELETSLENKQAVRSALVYPIVIIFVATIVLYVLLAFAVPKIIQVFESSKQALPLITKIVVAISDLVSAYGFYGFILIFMLIFTFFLALRNEDRRRKWHNYWIHSKILGNWDRMANVSDWCQSLGMLLSSGVPLVVALKVSNQNIGNLWLRERLVETEKKILEGSSLYQAIKHIDIMPAFMLHMISSGEASSELEDMLLRVGEFYRKKLNDSIKSFIQILQPAIMVVLGGLVAVIISAIFMPMMNLMSGI